MICGLRLDVDVGWQNCDMRMGVVPANDAGADTSLFGELLCCQCTSGQLLWTRLYPILVGRLREALTWQSKQYVILREKRCFEVAHFVLREQVGLMRRLYSCVGGTCSHAWLCVGQRCWYLASVAAYLRHSYPYPRHCFAVSPLLQSAAATHEGSMLLCFAWMQLKSLQ